MKAGTLVGLRQVDHRGSAVAAVAVHVLEQVQCRAAAPVEDLHVLGFGAQWSGAAELADERVQFRQTTGVECGLRVQGVTQGRKQRAQLGVGVAQQPGQRAQRVSHSRRGGVEEIHRYTVALMGIVRFFSLPKRLVSDTPSLQPLPKEKPQPPRTLNAFSAYSRCVVGITKRSS